MESTPRTGKLAATRGRKVTGLRKHPEAGAHQVAGLPKGTLVELSTTVSKGVLMRCMWLMENTSTDEATGVAEVRIGLLRGGSMRPG